MLGRLFGKDESSIRGDYFGLGPLCHKLGLSSKARKIVKSSRNAVEIRLAEFDCQLPHVASRVGGPPALPDDQPIAGRLVPLGAQLGARNAFAVRGGSNHVDGDALPLFFGRALSLCERSLGKTRLVTPA